MGLLSSFCRAVGRAVGRGVETVGKILHSEKTQEVGRNIQNACRKTASDTGRQHEYDQDTATERETQQIADILSSFSLGLNSQAGSIEVMAQQTVEQYFDNLTAAIQGVMGNNAMVRTLKSQKNIISSNIPGKLRDVLAKRVALTDSECSRILKMPAGTEKEKAMNDFGHKVIREGLDALEKSVSKSLDTVSDMVAEELDGMAKQQKLDLENFAAQLQDVLKHQGDSTSDRENGMLAPAERLSASEMVLDLLEEAAGFWNAIGLPNAADIQNLTELCRQQAQRIETLENEVRQLREIVQTQAEQDNAREDEREQAIRQTVQDGFAQQQETFAEWREEQTKKNAVILRKNTMLHQQTQEKLAESAKNQDELLRILIVNSLGDELEKDMEEPKAKAGRKKQG